MKLCENIDLKDSMTFACASIQGSASHLTLAKTKLGQREVLYTVKESECE